MAQMNRNVNLEEIDSDALFGIDASEKFWKLEKRIKEDKHHPGVIMELSKSEAIWDIVRLIRLKVITYDDLSEFSDELQQEVKRILEISR